MATNSKLDLNKLRDIVHENERKGDELPAAKSKKVFVDRDGDVKLGSDVSDREARTMSEVPQSTFSNHDARDAEVVRRKLPADTRAVTAPSGMPGWRYSVRCQLGNDYRMFLWFDGSAYQVLVLDPELEAKWRDPHTGHLYGDGRICMGSNYGSGERSIEAAYGKSVLWATGMSTAVMTGRFAFNYNQ
jgi:hypothetical protein